MDSRLKECANLTELDGDLLFKISEGLPIVADISRADVLLCTFLNSKEALVLEHIKPHSISSPYRSNITGRIYRLEDRPLLFRTLQGGTSGQDKKQLLSSGAPIIQDYHPIYNVGGKVVAAMIIEMTMIEHERHRRRDRNFRRSVRWLQGMAARGELENSVDLRRYGPYDGIYLVDRERKLAYMNGIATNLFRSIGVVKDMRGQDVTRLEEVDGLLADQAFDAHRCVQLRTENEDGRVWIRSAIPLHVPRQNWGWPRFKAELERLTGGDKHHPSSNSGQSVDGALILIHNATQAVQSQRQLNVKSAIIQEVHHRVKNNLQTIAAIMRIQSRRCETEEGSQVLSEAVNRILSMSVIHEFLSQDEHRPINIREVCQRIVSQVTQVALRPEQKVDIRVIGPNIRLPSEQATATAMILNELLLNAIEHGVGLQKHGHIVVQLDDLGDAVQIAIVDDGSGLPEDFDTEANTSLGLQIVNTLVQDDLKGNWQIERLGPDSQPGLSLSENGSEKAPSDTKSENGQLPYYNTQARIEFPKRAIVADSHVL